MVGSHNYNLNDEYSDLDYKVFVLPTFDDLYYNNQYSTDKVVGTDMDYDVHDIRKLATLLWKANINFIETLFSEEYHVGSDVWGWRMRDILEQKDRLARMNLPYLWDACQGIYYNKFKLLEKGTAGTIHLVEKYGYDTKQAQHCYRCLDLLERYLENDFNDFKLAIWYKDGAARDFLLQVKQGFYTLDEFKKIVQAKRKDISRLEELYKIQAPLYHLREWLDEQVKELIRDSMAEAFS
jgi:predicted nucleotidyltransferase